MVPVLALGAVPTHGGLTRLAVELHHLQRATNRFTIVVVSEDSFPLKCMIADE